jgi:hypothetical protein
MQLLRTFAHLDPVDSRPRSHSQFISTFFREKLPGSNKIVRVNHEEKNKMVSKAKQKALPRI